MRPVRYVRQMAFEQPHPGPFFAYRHRKCHQSNPIVRHLVLAGIVFHGYHTVWLSPFSQGQALAHGSLVAFASWRRDFIQPVSQCPFSLEF